MSESSLPGHVMRVFEEHLDPRANVDSRFHAETMQGVNAAIDGEGYAVGLDVWEPLQKAYLNHLDGDNQLAQAQLMSLLDAIREQVRNAEDASQ